MSFTLDLSRAVEKTKGKTELMVKKVMLELFSNVISKSPVDSGRFRANWIVGYGSANVTINDDLDKRQVGDKTGPTIGRMDKEIKSSSIGGQSIFLTNSLPYSLVLENGRANGKPGSLQAPNGMVRISLIEISAHYGA